MLSITARDIHVEFPIYDSYRRSLRHQLGLGTIARSLDRFKTRKLKIGGDIDTGQGGKMVVKALNGVSIDLRAGLTNATTSAITFGPS